MLHLSLSISSKNGRKKEGEERKKNSLCVFSSLSLFLALRNNSGRSFQFFIQNFSTRKRSIRRKERENVLPLNIKIPLK